MTNRNWVFEWAEDERVHVYPIFGPKHVLTLECWCHPELDSEEKIVVLHEVAQ